MEDIVQRVRAITVDRDYASQLTSLITQLEITDSQARAIYGTIDPAKLDAELPFIKASNEVAKYEGFNPREMILMLLNSHAAASERAREDPQIVERIITELIIGQERTQFEFSSNQPFNRDMQFICLMFITRGAAYDKIMRKSGQVMRDCMRILKGKYNINTTQRRPGQALDSKTITTPRIAASFPSITVGLFHKGFGRTIYDPESMFPGQILPRAMHSPMMPSMLPKKGDAPLAIMLSIAVKVDDI